MLNLEAPQYGADSNCGGHVGEFSSPIRSAPVDDLDLQKLRAEIDLAKQLDCQIHVGKRKNKKPLP